ncbi:MAG: hypothetical protein PHU23_02170 [Dehalococcoidales bacterium]|nr:hypothetical protein [Dehalococcoidales bacterium]
MVINEQLRMAEGAEAEFKRLQTLTAEAPALRAAAAKEKRHEKWRIQREAAMNEAKKHAVRSEELQQETIKSLLQAAAESCYQLFAAIREIASERDKAVEMLLVVDKIDYLRELESRMESDHEGKEKASSYARALAAMHGIENAKRLLEDLGPGFDYFTGCDLSQKLNRDVAMFVKNAALPPIQMPVGSPNDKTALMVAYNH